MSRYARMLLLWLLPLFALRALIPAGVMLAASDGRLTLVMCNGMGPLSAPTPAVEHAHHAHHAGHAPADAEPKQDHREHERSICPFALASVFGAALEFAPAHIEFDAKSDFVFPEVVVVHALAGPARALQSRAPPRFS